MSESFPTSFGRYVLTERLAVGGMAELFLARADGAHGFEKQLVIKRLLPHMAADPHFQAMFVNEAKLTARLTHPKIAQTYELGRHDDALYIAMEYIDGLDVLTMLRECAYRRMRMPPEASAYIVHEVLDALDFAHQHVGTDGKPLGIIHRDISPSNVVLSRRGDVKLIDFGIARATEQEHRTRAGTLKGKYGYMSPEQVLDVNIDARSDLFSVGIVLAEMLTGRRLFAAPNELDVLLMVRDARLDRLDRFGASIDPELMELVRTALRKNPDQRYQSAGEFRNALSEWLFSNRHRVTPQRIGELVEDLYVDACTRRRASMDEATAAAAALAAQVDAATGERPEAAVGTVSAADAAADDEVEAALSGLMDDDELPAAPTDDDQGIPLGEIAVGDSMPILSVELGEEAPPAAPARARAGRDPTDDGIPIVVGDLASGPVPVPDAVASQARRATRVPRPAPADGALDLGPAGGASRGDRGAVPEALGDTDQSIRYPTIEQAIASLAPSAPDPSALDFDDREISQIGHTASRPRRIRLPTAEEVAHAAPPAPPPLEEVEGEPDDNGDLTMVPPVQVLYRLAVSKAKGLLVVRVGGIRKEIYVMDGVPEFVSSNVAGELFGEYLVKQKVLSSGELAMALAMMPHYGGRLGDTLVGLGLMKPLDVFRMLTRQVRDKLIDVCTWSKGTFAWYEGRENKREAFPLDLNALEVLGAGAMALPEQHVSEWLVRVAGRKPRSTRNTHVRPQDFQLGGIVRDVFDVLDGTKVIEVLAGRYTSAPDRMRFLRVLYLLVHTDLATLDLVPSD